MKIKTMTIRCECGESFEIERAAGKSMALMLEFARCPRGHPRSANADRIFRNDRRCSNPMCNVPIRLRSRYSSRGLCNRCYLRVWKDEHAAMSAEKTVIVAIIEQKP